MATPEQLRALRNFIERTKRMETYAVPKMVAEGRVHTAVHRAIGGATTVETEHPSEEQIGGFVVSLRFFIMDNEDTSFRKMDAMLQQMGLESGIVAIFSNARQKLNQWLDARSPLGFGDGPLTNRKILETFMYGDIAHTNKPEVQAEFLRWRKHPTFFPLLQAHMIHVLGNYIHFLKEGACACSLALKSLGEREDH